MNGRAANGSTGLMYGRFLLFIAGMGGLLYGIDVGIISAALLYLGKTVNLTLGQTSIIVAAVLGGSMFSSLVAGFLADWIGRKSVMIISGFLFVGSVGVIVLSHSFAILFAGRLMQGMSGGFIAVVVPLYLAECLPASSRGRGSAIFQLMLTVGLVIAAITGWYYKTQADAVIHAAGGNAVLIRVAEDHAWRGMFLSVIYPGLVFFLGAFFLSETPRWLLRKGRGAAALQALRKTASEEDAAVQFAEMELLTAKNREAVKAGHAGSLLQRKYVVPFLLACVILACNQATGINSILAYLVIILTQAGMSAAHATQGNVEVMVLNSAMTLIAVALVDRKGRKFLLTLGASGILIALTCSGVLFYSFESKRVDVKAELVARMSGDTLSIPMNVLRPVTQAAPMALNVLYSYGAGDKIATALSTDSDGVLKISPDAGSPTLTIKHAYYGPVPGAGTGWLVAICIGVFIASFAVGPGVVVWLALSELMPTRIRSGGMGFALLVNQGVSTLIAGVFLPMVGRFGYHAMFWFWALCTVVYLATAVFFLPETKGKTLEEIELYFK